MPILKMNPQIYKENYGIHTKKKNNNNNDNKNKKQ